MKVYHWTFYIEKRRFDYLVMAADVESARFALVESIGAPGGIEAQQAGHDTMILSEAPMFIAGENYPIVIWEGK